MKNDIVIIGASLAGSYCAYLLGKNGYKVSLLDPLSIPKEKACGEGLSSIGMRYLEHSGLWNKELENKANQFIQYDITFRNGEKLLLNSKHAIGYAIQRNIIDANVFNSALDTKNVSCINSKALSVKQEKEEWEIETESGPVFAKHLIVAAGKYGRSLFEKNKPAGNLKPYRYGLTIRAQGLWKNGLPDKIIIKNNRDIQILITPFINHKINISILVAKDYNLREKKEDLIKQGLEFAEQSGFTIHNSEECQGAGFISDSQPESIPEGLYLIGDCAEIFDPIGGMGMAHALFSASIAAESLVKTFNHKNNSKISISHWQKYNSKRKIIAGIFRLLTFFSYQLNVKENYVIKRLALLSPALSRRIITLISDCFPVTGLATSNSDIKKTLNGEHNEIYNN